MKKSDFVRVMRDIGEYSDAQEAEKALNTFLLSVTEILKNGENISFVEFGSFEMVKKRTRKKGENYLKATPIFRVSEVLKQKISYIVEDN